MTKRATFSQAELNRAAKAAEAVGYQVVIQGSVMRLLPAPADTANPQHPDQADSDWDKALGLE